MFLLIATVFVLGFVGTTLSQDEEAVQTTRLVTEGEFPFVGYMIEEFYGMCGVVIISDSVIATAAHCFVRWSWDGRQTFIDLSSTKVLFGSLIHGDGKPGRIKDYKTPANFKATDNGIYLSDFGMANLDAKLDITNKIKPATFVSSDPVAYKKAWDDLVQNGKTCLSIGWEVIESAKRGDMTYHKTYSDFLKVTIVQPWTDADCTANMPDADSNIVPFGGICAFPTPKTNYKAYAGDEGGALYCEGNLYAVLSTLRVDVESERPGQYYLFDAYLSEHYSEVSAVKKVESNSAGLKPITMAFFWLCLFPATFTLFHAKLV